jgi:nitrite reductase (NO-forming)
MGDIKVNGKTITGVPPVMPGLGFLPDDQLANMMTYVRNAWGNKGDAVSADDIAEYRKAHADRLAPWTEAELEAAK